MYFKALLLLGNIIIFTVIFSFLEDSNFSGINNIQTLLKDELIRKKVEEVVEDDNSLPTIKEAYQNFNITDNDETNEKIEDIIIEEKKEIEEKVKDDALMKGKPHYPRRLFERFFDRFYFSVVTGTTLGYGDIYPDSKLSKLLVMIELLISVTIVFFM